MTSYPESVQTFPTMQDMTATDFAYVKSYQNYMVNGNVSQANAALISIADYDKKMLTTELLNTIFDTVTALQANSGAPDIVVSATQPTTATVNMMWWEIK